MSYHLLKYLCACLWRLGYQVDRRTRLAPRKNIQFKTPLLGVGSRLSGGAGKTPLVRMLAKHYAGQGLRVGVLCHRTGDEDLWLGQEGGFRVIATHDRWRTCRELDGTVDLWISDDGLEDRRLRHGVWICLDWGERALDYSDLLPLGPCRSLRRDHADVFGQLRCAMEGSGCADADLVFATEMPRNSAGSLPEEPVVALAGIARPERFFDGLQALGVPVRHALPRPDHDRGFARVVQDWRSRGFPVVMTEKDAVRLDAAARRDPGVFVAGLAMTARDFPFRELARVLGIGNY